MLALLVPMTLDPGHWYPMVSVALDFALSSWTTLTRHSGQFGFLKTMIRSPWNDGLGSYG